MIQLDQRAGPPVQTVADALRRAAQSPEGITFVDDGEDDQHLPWGEILVRARRLAASLQALGLRHGDRVAIVLPTSPAFLDAFFGAILAGAVPVPLYPPIRLVRIDEYHIATACMVQKVRASVLLTDRRLRRLLGQVVERSALPRGCHVVEDLLGREMIQHEATVTENDLGFVQFSSGSTVDPKPVMLTHGQIIAQCRALHSLMPPREDQAQVGVSWLPLYHDMGLVGCLLSAAYYPGKMVLLKPERFLARPTAWLRALSRFGADVSPAPNFAYALALKRVRDEDLVGLDLSRWRYALCGAEPVMPEVLRRFGERFAPCGFDARALMPVYGLSEATLAATFPPPGRCFRVRSLDAGVLAREGRVVDGPREVPSVGRPVPGTALEIRNDQGACCADGEVGHVFLRGPSIMKGYFDDPKATARALQDGWLDTGDLGFVEDGELYLCGRAKDVIILRGANHAPQEFEEALVDVPGLRSGCAIAVGWVDEPPTPNDQGEGEQLLVLAEHAPWSTLAPPGGDAGDRDHVLVTLADRIRVAMVERTGVRPHRVVLVAPGTLPRTSSGKMRRQEALRRYVAGELRAPTPMTTLRLASEIAKSTFSFVRASFRHDDRR